MKYRLELFDHIERMTEDRVPEKVFLTIQGNTINRQTEKKMDR